MNEETKNKSLLIIKAQASSLVTVENFLKNREWKVKSTTNLKEALAYLVQEQPQFVLVGIDHPNQKIRKLPKVLTQAFPVCVIAFTEGTSTAAYNLLSSCAQEYLLYPPVTGPAVERTVNKYYKDLQTRGQNTNQIRSGTHASDEGVISIRGDSQNYVNPEAQNILASLLGDDNGIVGIMPGTRGSDLGMSAHGLGAGELHSGGADAKDSTTSSSYVPSQNKKNTPRWEPLPQASPAKKARLTPEQIETHPMATKKESIISEGTKKALNESCIPTPFESSNGIEESTHVACIVIESTRFAGYLITAMGKNKSVDDAFLQGVRNRLFKFLKQNGEDIGDRESLDLKIKQVPFEDWALEQAEFLRKSIHDGNEVAMAFFPRTDVKANLGDSPDEDMASIKIEDLLGDIAVEFNLYVRLPRNDKYLLYTPRGGIFYNKQKERLQSQGISLLHVMKMDSEDVDKYRAQNFLNKKIDEFEEKEKRDPARPKEKKIA